MTLFIILGALILLWFHKESKPRELINDGSDDHDLDDDPGDTGV